MSKLTVKSYQKLVFFTFLISLCKSAMASDPTGLATFFIGLPSLVIGTILVSVVTVGYYYFPSQRKKIIGLVLGVPVLLFNLLVMFTDTLSLLQKELARTNDVGEKLSLLSVFESYPVLVLYPVLCCLLGYFIYRLLSNKFKKWESN